MTTNRSVLVGIDFSATCVDALKKATHIARACGCRVLCFHILDEEVLKDFCKDLSLETAEILEAAKVKLS